jgi:hypothetical protein
MCVSDACMLGGRCVHQMLYTLFLFFFNRCVHQMLCLLGAKCSFDDVCARCAHVCSEYYQRGRQRCACCGLNARIVYYMITLLPLIFRHGAGNVGNSDGCSSLLSANNPLGGLGSSRRAVLVRSKVTAVGSIVFVAGEYARPF